MQCSIEGTTSFQHTGSIIMTDGECHAVHGFGCHGRSGSLIIIMAIASNISGGGDVHNCHCTARILSHCSGMQ